RFGRRAPGGSGGRPRGARRGSGLPCRSREARRAVGQDRWPHERRGVRRGAVGAENRQDARSARSKEGKERILSLRFLSPLALLAPWRLLLLLRRRRCACVRGSACFPNTLALLLLQIDQPRDGPALVEVLHAPKIALGYRVRRGGRGR